MSEVLTRSVPAGPSERGAEPRVLVTRGRATAAVAAACCLAIGMVVAAPLSAASNGRAAEALYRLFAPVCHQIAERSFHLFGHPLAVCHRCFGFYLGFTLGLAVLPFVRRFRDWLLDRPRRILYFLAPTGIDWLAPMNTPASRFGSALLASAPIALLVWAAIDQITVRRSPKLLDGDTMTPNRLKAAAIGGGAAGVASQIPGLNFVNCLCCALVVGGGMLAVFLALRNEPATEKAPYGDGALIGALAGVVAAIVGAIVLIPITALFGDPMEQVVRMLEGIDNLPPEILDALGGDAAETARTFAVVGFLMTLAVDIVFSTIGGVIGAAVFHRKA